MGLSTLADSHFLAFYSRVPVSHLTFTYLPIFFLRPLPPPHAIRGPLVDEVHCWSSWGNGQGLIIKLC